MLRLVSFFLKSDDGMGKATHDVWSNDQAPTINLYSHRKAYKVSEIQCIVQCLFRELHQGCYWRALTSWSRATRYIADFRLFRRGIYGALPRTKTLCCWLDHQTTITATQWDGSTKCQLPIVPYHIRSWIFLLHAINRWMEAGNIELTSSRSSLVHELLCTHLLSLTE